LFPFGDLSDLISTKISEQTQNQVFLQFSRMHLSFWPPGITLGVVSVDSPYTGLLNSKELTVAPAITFSNIFGKKYFGTAIANGLFNGNLKVSMNPGQKSESGNDRQKIEIQAEHLNLQELREVVQMPIFFKGRLDLQGSALADLTFAEQPEAEVLIKADKFELPSQTINSAMGPINVPDLRMNSIEIKGHMNGGKLVIDEGRIGSDNDEIHGSVKGDMGIILRNQGGIQPLLGAYSLDIDLTVKSALEDRLSLFLVALSQFKTTSGDSSRFRFKATSQNINFPPTMTALH